MSATMTHPGRVAAQKSWKTTPPAAPQPQATPAARAAAYADAVMAAVLTLQAQLRDPDARVSQAAAVAIVDLEKTRMRHDTPVAGTHAPLERLEDLDRPVFAATGGSGTGGVGGGGHPLSTGPAPFSRGEEELDEPDDETVEQVRQFLQQEADEQGTGEVVSRERAWRVARQALERVRQNGPPVPA